MKPDRLGCCPRWFLCCVVLLTGCAGLAERERVADEVPPPQCLPVDEAVRPSTTAPEEISLRAMLAYYGNNARAPAAAPRERPLPRDPYLLMQLAIQLGQARPPELARAQSALEAVLKSPHPSAAYLVPLARLLHEQYGERLRLEAQSRDAQRRQDQLQEKLDALSAIERSLPTPSTQRVPKGAQENPR